MRNDDNDWLADMQTYLEGVASEKWIIPTHLQKYRNFSLNMLVGIDIKPSRNLKWRSH